MEAELNFTQLDVSCWELAVDSFTACGKNAPKSDHEYRNAEILRSPHSSILV